MTARPDFVAALGGATAGDPVDARAAGAPGVCAIGRRRRGRARSIGETVAAIVAKTDGVPLFVEELTKSVIESAAKTVRCRQPSRIR